MLLTHWARRAASRAACTAGNKRAIKTAMIAITTSSSISVKADRAPGALSWPCEMDVDMIAPSRNGDDALSARLGCHAAPQLNSGGDSGARLGDPGAHIVSNVRVSHGPACRS